MVHVYPDRESLQGLEMEIFKLVSFSATPQQWKEWLRVPLEHAAARGNLDLFNSLLGAGADGSAGWRGCRGRTLLDSAAVGGNEDIVSGLLRVGSQPDVDVVSVSPRRSALYTATVCGHEAVARRLVIAGADVNFRDPVHKCHVLFKAILDGHVQLAKDLVIGGADPNSQTEENHSCGVVYVGELREEPYGETPLICASRMGHLTVAETLLAAGADANIRDSNGYSALDYAAEEGHVDCLQAIARHGADVNACDERSGFTALHTASENDQATVVDALLEAGADIECKADGACNALSLSASGARGSCKALLALLKHGAAVNAVVGDGDTPLHSACHSWKEGLASAVDLLLRWGADETASNNEGLTPAGLLDEMPKYERHNNSDPSVHNEVERARLLLSRAPADRTWRRRGWLVMLRSRAAMARNTNAASRDGRNSDASKSEDGRGVVVVAAGGGTEDEGYCEADRNGKGGNGADGIVRRKMSSEGGDHRGDGEGGVLSGVVALLVEMEPESVFREVVGFL